MDKIIQFINNITTIVTILAYLLIVSLPIIIGIKTLIGPNDKVEKNLNTNNTTKIYPYKKRNILTNTEYNFYKTLKEECDKQNFIICPKVRMEDFLEVTTRNERFKYRGYIKSRHIDFIICNQEMKMLCGIELDDYSHYNRKAQKNDKFKNDVFKSIDIPLYRIVVGHGSYKEQLEAAFYVMKQKEIPGQNPGT